MQPDVSNPNRVVGVVDGVYMILCRVKIKNSAVIYAGLLIVRVAEDLRVTPQSKWIAYVCDLATRGGALIIFYGNNKRLR